MKCRIQGCAENAIGERLCSAHLRDAVNIHILIGLRILVRMGSVVEALADAVRKRPTNPNNPWEAP